MVWLAPSIEAMAEPGVKAMKMGVRVCCDLTVSSREDGLVSQRWDSRRTQNYLC